MSRLPDKKHYGARQGIDKQGEVLFVDARCLVQRTCSPAEVAAYKTFDPSGMNKAESAKSSPGRDPANKDSIDIEIVGRAMPPENNPRAEAFYGSVTDAQKTSLKWLVGELTRLLAVPMTAIFRHPEVSCKMPAEAQIATWR